MSKKIVKCPNCGSKDFLIKEWWRHSSVDFDFSNGKQVGSGTLNNDSAEGYKLQGFCDNCNHQWYLRGATQITDIDGSIDISQKTTNLYKI